MNTSRKKHRETKRPAIDQKSWIDSYRRYQKQLRERNRSELLFSPIPDIWIETFASQLDKEGISKKAVIRLREDAEKADKVMTALYQWATIHAEINEYNQIVADSKRSTHSLLKEQHALISRYKDHTEAILAFKEKLKGQVGKDRFQESDQQVMATNLVKLSTIMKRIKASLLPLLDELETHAKENIELLGSGKHTAEFADSQVTMALNRLGLSNNDCAYLMNAARSASSGAFKDQGDARRWFKRIRKQAEAAEAQDLAAYHPDDDLIEWEHEEAETITIAELIRPAVRELQHRRFKGGTTPRSR